MIGVRKSLLRMEDWISRKDEEETTGNIVGVNEATDTLSMMIMEVIEKALATRPWSDLNRVICVISAWVDPGSEGTDLDIGEKGRYYVQSTVPEKPHNVTSSQYRGLITPPTLRFEPKYKYS